MRLLTSIAKMGEPLHLKSIFSQKIVLLLGLEHNVPSYENKMKLNMAIVTTKSKETILAHEEKKLSNLNRGTIWLFLLNKGTVILIETNQRFQNNPLIIN